MEEEKKDLIDARLVLIDTSSWVEALRMGGKSEVRERVKRLILEDRAAWCDLVAVELWNGARGVYERKELASLEYEMICLPTTDAVWQLARDLARKCRSRGITVPSTDLVICSCALAHGAEIEHSDSDFEVILKTHSQG